MDRHIYRQAVAPHNFRVGVDGGIPSDNVQATILLMQDNLEWVGRDKYHCISPELFGVKTRTSAPYQFATKGYSANSPQRELGDNIVVNGTFDENINGFTASARCTVAWNAGKYLEAVSTGTSDFVIASNIGMVIGERYLITFKAKSPNSTSVPKIITAHFSDIQFVVRPNLTTGWQTYVFTAIASSATLYLYGVDTGASVGTQTDFDDIYVHRYQNIDLAQTTANSQPYLSKIAPSEPQGLQNTNGDSRFMTHPAISFAANEKWTVEVVLNFNGKSSNIYFSGDSLIAGGNTLIGIYNSNFMSFRNASGTLKSSASAVYNPFIGKNTIITYIANGDGTLLVYINGIYIFSFSNPTNVKFAELITAFGGSGLAGKLFHYSIIPDALSASRIAYRAALLRSIFPEIPTVKVTGLDCAVRALDIVCTPAGNLISEVQLASNTEKITGGNFEGGLIGTVVMPDGVATWSLNESNPISGTRDGRLVVTSIGTNNSRPRLDFTVGAITSGQYVKVSFNYKVNSGTCILSGIYDSFTPTYLGSRTLTGTGTFSFYLKTTSAIIAFDGRNLFDLQIDNLSYEQVGWAGLTDLYNGLIAQGQTAAQAQLAASAWCHHSNDLALGTVYGKIYNGYAKDQLVADLASSNFGYHIATEAEWNAILATGVAGLKAMGTAYWTSANGTNVSGLTLLGGGLRQDTDGVFAENKIKGVYWCGDSDKIIQIAQNNSTATTATNKKFGAYILLIKNY